MLNQNSLIIETQDIHDDKKEDQEERGESNINFKFEHEDELEEVIRILGYEMGPEIGKSLFGKVYLCVDRKTGIKTVIKTCKRSRLTTKWESPEEEYRLIRLATKRFRKGGQDTGSNHVLSLHNFVKTRHWTYTVAEYCQQGDLFDIISQVVCLSEEVARDYFHQSLMALRQIHVHGIYHLDVSLENLFLADGNRIVLADFGCARKWQKGKRANFGNYRPGKWQYMCPEIFDWQPVFGELADVWSIGVCLFIMLTGKAPFRSPSNDDLNFVRLYYEKDFSRCEISEEAKDLLSKILCPADQRYKISDILRHPWMMFQASCIMGPSNSSRPSTPLRRRSLTHVSPFVSPAASPATSPRDHLKSFVIPKGFLGKHEVKLKCMDNKMITPWLNNRRTFSHSMVGDLRNSMAALNIQHQSSQLRSHV